MASTLTGTNHEFEKLVVETQLYLLVRFARSLGAYRAIHQDFEKVGNNEQFWIQTADSNFLRAVTEWCMVFGVDNNETHWKNAVRTEPAEFTQAVRDVITAAGGFTQPQWEAYHADVRNFRDTYASHRQLVVTGNVPDMTPALEIAKAYFEWLKQQIPGTGQPKPLAEHYLQAQIETLQVLRQDLTM